MNSLQQHFAADGRPYYLDPITMESVWTLPQPEEHEIEQATGAERVIECKLIPNTKFMICLTNYNHEFFCNVKTMKCVNNSWDIPDEILEIVGNLLNNGMEDEEEEDDAKGEGEREEQDAQATLESYDDQRRKRTLEDDFPDTVAEKRVKLAQEEEEKAQLALDQVIPEVPEPVVILSEAELQANFMVGPVAFVLDEDLTPGQAMLESHKVSPFSTWDIEGPKLSSDPSYIAISGEKVRRAYYTLYAQTSSQIALATRSLANETLSAADHYAQLLQAKVLTYKLRFDDFERRHKRDPRFQNVNAAERRSMFDERAAECRREEKKAKAGGGGK